MKTQRSSKEVILILIVISIFPLIGLLGTILTNL
jgi:biopolymer transport protein ExbB/TolQ